MQARFFLHLKRRRGAGVFAVVYVAARQLQTHLSTMNRCRRISSSRSPASSRTTVIAQRRIRKTYCVKRT